VTSERLRTAGRVLVVDDDHSLRHALTRALELENYEVAEASDGLDALELFESGAAPDLVILDLLMPRLDGLATCRAIRAKSRVPILILTARGDVDERVEGLDAGADDYLSKPFAVVELLARVRALLRRTSTSSEMLHYADLELDPVEHRVVRGAREVELTRIEFSLLELFLTHPRRVLGRREIFEQVWGYDPELASNSLEVYVGYLRRKTEAAGEPRLIHTVRGIGYVLREAL
jgi:two-component system response regulator MprA